MTYSDKSLLPHINQTEHKCHDEPASWIPSVIPVLIMIISVLGIGLNIFVLMVFCLHKKSHSTAQIYLTNLAAADLILVSFLPFWAVYISNNFNWTFSLFLCKAVNASILKNVYCSIYFLVLVSIDRYLALVKPLSHEKIRTPCFATLGCALVWIFGFLLSLPALIHRELVPSGNKTHCSVNYQSTAINLTTEGLISVFGFIIPVPIVTFCTIKILRTLRHRLTEGVNGNKTNKKANMLLLAVFLSFVICWVPFHLVKILFVLIDVGILTECILIKRLSACLPICTYFAFFNSVLNPILYVIVGKDFQATARRVKRTWSHRGSIITKS